MIQDSFIESHIVRNNGAKGVLFKVFIIITALILIVILNVVPILLGLNIIFVTGMLSAALVWGVVARVRMRLSSSALAPRSFGSFAMEGFLLLYGLLFDTPL